jgi:hypothetical protein
MKTIVFAFICLTIFSCSTPDRSKYVQQLDSLSTALENTAQKYEALQLDQVQSRIDTVNAHLEYIQSNYQGDMKKDMSFELSEYRSIRKLIPELGNKREEISNNLAISRIQITDLKKAINENATHDAVGNEMNDVYYKKIIAQEINANKDLVSKMEFIISRTDSVYNRYNRHYTQVKYWVDSLRSSRVRILP